MLVFTNELGNRITIDVECDEENKTTYIKIIGPSSISENTLTLYESQRLREALIDEVP